jgi:hypothetical protein
LEGDVYVALSTGSGFVEADAARGEELRVIRPHVGR